MIFYSRAKARNAHAVSGEYHSAIAEYHCKAIELAERRIKLRGFPLRSRARSVFSAHPSGGRGRMEIFFDFLKKVLDKHISFVYNSLGILRQQVPVKASAFLPR